MSRYVQPEWITAEQIKEKRKELEITQREFAELVGVSKPTVERWETSDKPITGPIVPLLRLLTPEYVKSITVPEKAFPIRMWYMYRDEVCTMIDVNERQQAVHIINYVRNLQFRAFGVNEEPTFREYEEFLESRCFPRTRDNMKWILQDLNLPFYDPYLIILKTEGRMAEDDFWIKVER